MHRSRPIPRQPLPVIYEQPPAIQRSASLDVAVPESPRAECRLDDWAGDTTPDAATDRQRACAALLGTTPDGLRLLRAALAAK